MKLLSMSGFVPEEICDTVRFSGFSGNRNIAHYCGYASDFIDQVMYDTSIDGGVFPHTCDSSRIIKSYLGECNKFLYQLNVPVRNDESAIQYYAAVLKEYKAAIETYFGVKINDVAERTDIVAGRNAELNKLYDNLENIRYSSYIKMIHNMLKKPLREQKTESVEMSSGEGKKVFLVGSFLANTQIVELIEKFGMNIIGDTLPESGRLVSRKPFSASDDIFTSISRSVIRNRLSPTQNDFSFIMKSDLNNIISRGVSAVLFITQKYCEPYDYLFSVYKKMLDEFNIPILKITVSNSQDLSNSELMIETFAEMI